MNLSVNGGKAIVGLRPSFSAHVRLGERGAPVDFLKFWYGVLLNPDGFVAWALLAGLLDQQLGEAFAVAGEEPCRAENSDRKSVV